MVEPTIPVVVTGTNIASDWGQKVRIKVQDLADGHCHDGVGSRSLALYQLLASKGMALGYCGLDGSALVALANIPSTLTGKNADLVDGAHAGIASNQVFVIPSLIDSGDVFYVDGSLNVTRLGKGSNGQVLKLYNGLPSWQDETGAGAHTILNASHTDTLIDTLLAGDLLYANSTPKWARLPKGTDGKFLKMVSGLPAWAAHGLVHADLGSIGANDHHNQSHGSADHSGNVFPSADQDVGAHFVDLATIAVPSNPSPGKRRLFCDVADGKMKVQTSGGSTVSLEEQGGSTNFANPEEEILFAQSKSNGVATTAARSDHKHGNPALKGFQFDFYFYISGGSYYAMRPDGTVPYSNSTPDIGALMNSVVSSEGMANAVYTFAFSLGVFNYATAFKPPTNTGFKFIGEAISHFDFTLEPGTIFKTTRTTGKFIDCQGHATTPWGLNPVDNPLQQLWVEFITFKGTVLGDTWINASGANGVRFSYVNGIGTPTLPPVAGSKFIYISNNYQGEHVFFDHVNAIRFAIGFHLGSDLTTLQDCSIPQYLTYGIYLDGSSHAMSNTVLINVRNHQQDQTAVNEFIYDARPAPTSSSGKHVLYMYECACDINNKGFYKNVNGAWYARCGGGEHGSPRPFSMIETNYPMMLQVRSGSSNPTTSDLAAGEIMPFRNTATGKMMFVTNNAGTIEVSEFSVGGSGSHAVLSASHSDTLADSVLAGDILFGNATPKWARLAKGSDGQVLTLVSGLPSWQAAGGGTSHNLLSATHPDVVPASPVRGDLIIGNATPAWSKLALGTTGKFLSSDGSDPSWRVLAAADVPAISATKITSDKLTADRLPAGAMVLLSADEADASGSATNATAKTYSLGANSYSKIVAEAEVAIVSQSATAVAVTVDLKIDGSNIDDTVTEAHPSGGSGVVWRSAWNVKASKAQTSAATVTVAVTVGTLGTGTWYVRSLRVWGVV